LIEGFIRVARLPALDGPLNLGNPEEFSILELAQTVLELTGSKSPIERRPLPVDDPKHRRPDIKLARELLGFSPHVQLKEGLSHTVDELRGRLQAKGESARALH
jgi:UDP-glucuronate decarboxylase